MACRRSSPDRRTSRGATPAVAGLHCRRGASATACRERCATGPAARENPKHLRMHPTGSAKPAISAAAESANPAIRRMCKTYPHTVPAATAGGIARSGRPACDTTILATQVVQEVEQPPHSVLTPVDLSLPNPSHRKRCYRSTLSLLTTHPPPATIARLRGGWPELVGHCRRSKRTASTARAGSS